MISRVGTIPLDPEIIPLLNALNQNGYETIGSCAGHGKYGSLNAYGNRKSPRGIIYFKKPLSQKSMEVAKLICKKYGCKDIKSANGRGAITFSPMGRITTKTEYLNVRKQRHSGLTYARMK